MSEPREPSDVLFALARGERVDAEERELALQHLEAEHRRLPAHDLEAEEAVISACLQDNIARKVGTKPPLEAALPILRPDHYVSESHRRIFEAMLELHGRGKPVDVVTVGSWLKDTGRIAQVGIPEASGLAYLAYVLNKAPAIANVEAYARIVRSKWAMRELGRVTRAAAASSYVGTEELIAETHAALGDLLPIENQLAGMKASSIVESWQSQGPLERQPTGFAFLDDRIKGGLAFGDRLILNGAPDAVKTAFLACLAFQWAKTGLLVGVLAVDEDADAIVVRFAQMAGFTREDCEERDPLVLQDIARSLEALPLVVFDHETTIEEAATQLVAAAPARGAMLIIDSLQTASCASTSSIEESGRSVDERARVNFNVRAMRSVNKRYPRLGAAATSEMARTGYAKRPDERTLDMAASKSSSAIEYAARVMLTMRAVTGHEDLFSVSITKNKLGAKEIAFGLRLHRRSHALVEALLPQPADSKSDEKTLAKKRDELLERVVQYVAQHPRKPHGALRSGLRGKGVKGGNGVLDEAIERAVDLGRIVNIGTPARAAYITATTGNAAAAPANGVSHE